MSSCAPSASMLDDMSAILLQTSNLRTRNRPKSGLSVGAHSYMGRNGRAGIVFRCGDPLSGSRSAAGGLVRGLSKRPDPR